MAKFFETNLQRSTQKRNLSQFNVLIEDNSRLSPEFFNISQLEDEFSIGKNAFLIRGTEKLRSGSDVIVEVLDVNGDVIFTRTFDYKESNARVVSVFVYETTPTGPCTVNIMGETTRDRGGQPVPSKWEGKYNVRWSKKLNVNPNVYNINQVRFIRGPEISVDKETLRDLELSYTFSAGKNTKKLAYVSNIPNPPIGLEGRVNLNAAGSKNSILRINKNCGSFVPLLRGMENGTLILNDTSNFNLVPSSLGGDQDIQKLEFEVEEVRNENTITVNPIKVADQFSQFIELDCYQDFELEFIREDPTAVTQLNTQTCFIQVELRDIRTFAGTVLRAAVFARDFRTDDQYTFIGDFELPPEELMIDLNTNSTPKSKRVGVYLDQNDVDTFLEPLNSFSELEHNDSILLNSVNVRRNDGGNVIDNINFNSSSQDYGGVSISGQPEYYVNSTTTNQPFSVNDNTDAIVGFKLPLLSKNGNVKLESNTRYTLRFRYILENFDDFASDSEFGVFLRYKTRDDSGNFLEIEERLENVQVQNGIREVGRVEVDFEPSRESISGDKDDLQLIIKILNGNWYFGNFSLVPLQRPGFSPDFTTLFFPLERSILQELGDKIEFKVDLFDLNRNKIPVSLTSNSAVDISNCGQSKLGSGGDVFSATFERQGDGVKTEFTYTHGLGSISSYSITPETDDASAYSHTEIDSSELTVIYDIAPPSPGPNDPPLNLKFKATFIK